MLGKLIDYPGPLWRPYSVLALVSVFLFLCLMGIPLCFFTFLPFPPNYAFFFGRMWNRSVLFFYRIRVQVRGAENFRPQAAGLLVTNHQSLLDIPVAFEVFAVRLRMVAKKELFSIPVFGQLIRVGGMIPVDRGNRKSGQEVNAQIQKTFAKGEFVWVAPEGTRSPDHNLGPFKKGSFATAIQLGVPVQPFVIFNSHAACPKGQVLVRPGTVIDCEVLPPVSTQGVSLESRGLFSEQIREAMQARIESFYARSSS